uniref:Transposase (Putative), gypsy type n=1 Tax=Tanacetum cinerariifolium TaxID=118510 RepID=A0A6L2N2D2_TANCI|nr:hypothetical protein [Tanacetum cinerariifolium]
MDLLSFIRTTDHTKVRVAERQRAEDEPRILESTVGRVVSFLPIAPTRASSELEASVNILFDEGASGDGQDADVQPVAVTTHTIVEDVAPLQPWRQKKRKTVVTDAGGPSHPPKKLREYFVALGGVSTAGNSMAAVQSLFSGAMLEAEARGEPVPTLRFVTSSVSATLEREDRSPADSVPGPNFRTIGAPQRFVISSDSSHHSGANIAKAEVDSIIRYSAPAIATVTTVTTTIDTKAAATRAPVAPFLFGVGSSSTGRSNSVPGGFFDVSCSDFLIGGIRTIVDPDSDLQKVYVPRWSMTNGFGLEDSRICREMLDKFATPKFFASVRGMDHDQLFTEFNVGAARQISLNAKVRMRVEYNIRGKRKLRAVAIHLRAEVFKFESPEQSLRGEVGFLRDQNTALEREKNELNVKVTGLSASVKVREQEVADLDAQVTAVKLQNDNLVRQGFVAAYEGFFSQLDKFQDEKLEEWLLTYGMELAVAKCLNSTEYLSALGATISKAAEKGMQEGLSAGITHGAEDTIMNLLRLDDVLAERLGLTESQPHVDQLMVPIHHSPDQRVVGASALTFSLEVSNSRVKKM